MKKYKIRKLSPLWWVTRVGGIILGLLGCYCWIWLAYTLTDIL